VVDKPTRYTALFATATVYRTVASQTAIYHTPVYRATLPTSCKIKSGSGSIFYVEKGRQNKIKKTIRIMELRISEKKFVCVDYPAIVQNHDAMLQTLGGAAKVTAVTIAILHIKMRQRTA